MDNFSDIALSDELVRFRKKIAGLRRSMDALTDKTTDYYEHHQYLINIYSEILHSILLGIKESKYIGKGV